MRIFVFVATLLFLTIAFPVPGQADITPTTDREDAIKTLISRLDLNRPEIRQLNLSPEKPQESAKALLTYFRKRTSVKHPVDRAEIASAKGMTASEKDLKMADDAVKHIFVGQPAYPPHFCGEDIDWNSRPVADMEWVWQLNRMYFWDAMARTYWHTGDETYARAWCEQIIDWTRKNPNDEAHKHAWRSIEAGIRGYRWTALFQYFLDAPSFTPEVLVAFMNSCYDHAEYLMTKYSTNSNWGLMEAEGMAFIAINFPEFSRSEAWSSEAFRRFNTEIDKQVYPDGHQRELAMGYHIGCINWFLRTWELAEMNNYEGAFSPSYLDRIEKMCEVPMKLGLPNGTNAQFGDAWRGEPGQYRDRFADWAEMFEREDFTYMATGGASGKEPDATAFSLPESGLYSMRSSWKEDAVCMVLKCGPNGGGHCQPDNGTFVLYAGGRNLMPDGGSYIYSGDPENRAWFRQTSVHQTLTLNGENSQYAPKLLQWKPGEKLDILVVENESYENLTHRRAVFFVDKRYFVIVDEAFGDGAGEVDIHFQLAPGEAVIDDKSLAVTSGFEDGWNVLVQSRDQPGMTLTEEEGQVSFVYTIKEPRPAFRYRLNKNQEQKEVRFITLVAPYADEIPQIGIDLAENPVPGSNDLKLEIYENGRISYVGYSLEE